MIFMFHQVNDDNKLFYPAMPVSTFKNLMIFIKSNYEIIHVSQINSHFRKTKHSAAIISFDDAHYDIISNALPILNELKIPFNINVDTEIISTGKPQDFVRVYDIINHSTLETYLNEKFMKKTIIINRKNPIHTENEFTAVLSKLSSLEKRELVDDLARMTEMKIENYSRMLSEEDIVNLSDSNIEFGSHSHTHAILTNISDDLIHSELKQSKEILENLTKKKINILAYPNGMSDARVEKIAQDLGYSIFLQTEDKINKINMDKEIKISYKRINQYHRNLNEALAHSYGITNQLKKYLH
jgi:peptidoglycan/xylan/chitin deacetylase (PgdA/CDA1 family)